MAEISAALRRQQCLTAHRFVQCRSSICLKFIKVAPRQLLFKTVNIQQLADFTAWFANEATSPNVATFISLSTLGSKEPSKLRVTAWAAATRLNLAKEFEGPNVWTGKTYQNVTAFCCMQSDSHGCFAVACAATFQVAALRLTSSTAMIPAAASSCAASPAKL